MKRRVLGRSGFTLIEMLVVIAIIGMLAAIVVPSLRSAQRAAFKRRALVEMNTIKVAILQFYGDHQYMPWGTPKGTHGKVGSDVWTGSEGDQEQVMRWLTGENFMNKTYLQIPEKSRKSPDSYVFVDPWKQWYRVGMDRNLDGAVQEQGGGEQVRERVLVYSPGDPSEKKNEQDRQLRTW